MATQHGCAETDDTTPIAWDSPKMREIEHDWGSLWIAYGKLDHKRKTEYVDVLTSIERLFRSRLSKSEIRQLATSAEMAPAIPNNDNQGPHFVDDVLGFLAKSLVESRDRETLVVFLSKRCPERIEEVVSIEYLLAYDGRKLKDPILILSEAYAKCEATGTRKVLAAALRRAFVGHAIPGKDDAEFVKNAARFYEKEKGNLVVNERYIRNETVGPDAPMIDRFKRHPELYTNPPDGTEFLFKKKE